MKRLALQPRYPERICWGCDKYCGADDLACGNGTIRTPHPVELFGEDWADWAAELDAVPRPPARMLVLSKARTCPDSAVRRPSSARVKVC
jgi:hypothetical protein